jgi:alginate O-acetyltransferase complex protein AlgI
LLFTSFNFLLFFIIVYFTYWNVGIEKRKILLLLSSNIFYAFWDYRFLLLLNGTILIDFISGLKIDQYNEKKIKEKWVLVSIISCLFILFIFKYLNFFISSLSSFWGNEKYYFSTLDQIVLPVGISFYTFHGISYVTDLYNRKIKAEKYFINYALFVSYFPLLVAGPIERAGNLLNQISNKIVKFDYDNSVIGLRLILIGVFKKLVLADNFANIVDEVYEYYSIYSGSTILLATFIFGLQIYFDFSAYSNIASGVSKLFGYELVINFKFPYFAKNPKEFWSRWHISLSSFFRDYVYIPLGGDKLSKLIFIRNVFLVFVLSGLWHGANFTFLVWGVYHALMLIGNRYTFIFRNIEKNKYTFFISVVITYFLVNLGWIFFRSPSISTSIILLNKIFSSTLFSFPYIQNGTIYLPILVLALLYIGVEYLAFSKNKLDVHELFGNLKNGTLRKSFYYLIVILILGMGSYSENSFIYFQF